MRRLLLALVVLCPTAAAATPLVLHDVTVIDGTGAAAQPHRDVIVDGSTILAVQPAASSFATGARVIPLAGRWLVPGFMDLHAHLFLHPWDENGAIEARWDRPAALETLRRLLDFGVTTIRDPGGETEAAITLRSAVAAGKVAGPTILTAGRMLNAGTFGPEPFVLVHDAHEVEAEVRWQALAGVDAIKLYANLPADLARVAIAVAHRLGLPVIGHLSATTWTEAAQLGIDSLEHPACWSPAYLSPRARDGYDGSLFSRVYWLEQVDLHGPAMTALVDAILMHAVTVDPTLITMWTKLYGDVAAADPQILARAPAAFRAGWSAGSFTADWTPAHYRRAHAVWPKLLAWVGLLHARGVRLVVGTDTPTPFIAPGLSVHQEMAFLHEAGLSPREVLRAATSDAAHALRLGESRGRIAAGYRADLVVLSRDPLADIRNTRAIEAVYQAGVLVAPAPR